MTQFQFDSAVADTTGEELSVIEGMGFGPLHFSGIRWDADEPILSVDCPFCGAAALLANNPDDLPEFAECRRCETIFDYSNDEVFSANLDELVAGTRRSFAPAA